MLLLNINTIQHLHSTIPVHRLTGYKVTVSTQLGTAATKAWTAASGPASQAKAVGGEPWTWGHPQSQTKLGLPGFLLQSCVRLVRAAKASLLRGSRRWKHHQPQASRVIPCLERERKQTAG